MEFEVDLIDTEQKNAISYLNPFGLLWFICQNSDICEFMVSHLAGPVPTKLCFYVDAVVPGNPLRPDTHRTIETFYWTMMQLPGWLRSMASIGWSVEPSSVVWLGSSLPFGLSTSKP